MFNHFPNEQAAKAHLTAKGFSEVKPGHWRSADGLIDAWFRTTPTEHVCVQFIA